LDYSAHQGKKSCVDNFPVERFCHFRALNESAALMYSRRGPVRNESKPLRTPL
jgi:hypothetical protein